MPAINFKRQFVEKIRSGQKCQTIRRQRKRVIRRGMKLQLYVAQRTAHAEKIADAICTGCTPISIDRDGTIWVAGRTLTGREKEELARKDGFDNSGQLHEFFTAMHGLPLDAWIITWELI